jgi:hypothetical protein
LCWRFCSAQRLGLLLCQLCTYRQHCMTSELMRIV